MPEFPALECRLECWCAWNGGAAAPAGELPANGRWLTGDAADVSFLPAMQRRRLSPLARSAFAVAWNCLRPTESVPLVCSSAHGEMRRSVELLRSLAESEPLSPMSFSLSVHNAIPGQLSIALDNRAAVLAVAPGEEGMAAAMIEAGGLLLEGADSVVVVWYDEPLPPPYQRFGVEEPDRPAALAVRLGRGGDGPRLCLERRPGSVRGGQPAQLAGLLEWLGDVDVASGGRFQTRGNGAQWLWSLAA